MRHDQHIALHQSLALRDKVIEKRLHPRRNHLVGLAATVRYPLPAGHPVTAVTGVGLGLLVGHAAEASEVLFHQAVVETERSVATRQEGCRRLLGAQ